MAVPLAVGAVLGGAAPWLGRSLPPATAVRLLTAAMLGIALATGFVLAVAAILVIGQIPVVAAAGQWSARALADGMPVPPAVGGLAAVVVAGLVLAALRRAALAGRDLVRAARTCRRLGADVDGLVVIDDAHPDAYALPGLGGRVVVSTAMLRALPAAERRVLLAHEAAHLAHHHHLWVQAASVAAAANPLLRPALDAVRTGVERWADEVAAAEVGDRALVARALARAGLARTVGRRLAVPPALAGADHAVVDRARALLGGPPPRRRLLAGGVTALLLLVAAAALTTSVDTEARFEAAESVYAAAH